MMSRGESIFILSGTYLTHTTLSRNIGIVCTLVYHKDILYNEAQSGYVQMWIAQKIYTASASLAWLGRSTSSETNTAGCMRCPPPPNQHADAREWSQDGGGLFTMYACYVGTLRVSKCTVATSINNHCWRSNWVFLTRGHRSTGYGVRTRLDLLFFSKTPVDRRFFLCSQKWPFIRTQKRCV